MLRENVPHWLVGSHMNWFTNSLKFWYLLIFFIYNWLGQNSWVWMYLYIVHILIKFLFFMATPWKRIYSRHGYSNETEIVADPFESMHRIAVCKRPLKIKFGPFRLKKTINCKNVTFSVFWPFAIRLYVYYWLEHRSRFRLYDRITWWLRRILLSIDSWKYINDIFIDAVQKRYFYHLIQ